MAVITFIISFFLVVGLASVYLAWRLLKPARFRRSIAVSAILFIVFTILASPMRIIMYQVGIEDEIVDIFAWIGYLGLGFLSFLFAIMVGRDLLWMFYVIAKKIKDLLFSMKRSAVGLENGLLLDKVSKTGPDPERRRFVLNTMNAGIVLSGSLMTGVGCAQARQIPDIKTVPIYFKDLHADLDGFRIVQISDIHVSSTIKRPFVEGIVSKVNALNPDLVALTGDLVDGSVPRLKNDVAPLAQLRSKYGMFFVTGNHEYYSGVVPWVEHIERLGFQVLLNQNQLVRHKSGRLLVAGVTDFRAGRFLKDHISDPFQALQNAPDAHLKILLAHQPKNIFKAAEAGFDLQISGHTHGGQFFPWNLFVVLAQPYTSGLHTYDDTQIYISRGTGYWGPPIRLGASSEITMITLKNADSKESAKHSGILNS